jgi:hypothetical protein
MALLATVAALVVVPLHHDCHTDACHERVQAKIREHVDYVLRHRCNHSTVACVDRAAHLHRVSAPWMRSIAWCESRLSPYASNGTHFGLFQFDWQTWRGSPYARRGSVWSAKWNALAAAWYLRHGQASRWVCA